MAAQIEEDRDDDSDGARAPEEPLPSAPPEPPTAPPEPRDPAPPSVVLTLAQYARLCAEVAVFPEKAAAIFARCGLGEVSERRRVESSWQERLRRNYEESRVWQEVYQRYHAHWTAEVRRAAR